MSQTSPSTQRNGSAVVSLRTAMIIGTILMVIQLALIFRLESDPRRAFALQDILLIIASGLTTAALWCAARRTAGNRRAWNLLALAQLLYTSGEIAWTILESALQQVPFPTIAEAFYLSSFVLGTLGLLVLPQAPQSKTDRFKTLLDISIVLLAATPIIWVLAVGPQINTLEPQDALTVLLSAAYPLLDLILLAGVLKVLLSEVVQINHGPVWLLAAGVVSRIVADVSFAGQSVQGAYTPFRLANSAWIASHVLIGLAGVLQATRQSSLADRAEREADLRYRQFALARYLPYAWVVAAGVLFIWSRDYPLPISFDTLVLIVSSIVALVLIRQVVALNENARLYATAQHELAERARAQAEIGQLNAELERRVSERTAQLSQAEARYRAIVEQIPAIFYVDALDEYSSTTYMSPQCETLLGYAPEEWLADPELWIKIIHPDDLARVLAENAQTNATGKPFRLEYRLNARHGTTVWVRDEADLIRDEAGQPRFWQGVLLDITERKRAEEALRESEERYRLVTATISDFAYSVRVLDDGQLQAEWITPASTRVTGLPLDEMLRTDGWRSMIRPEDRQVLQSQTKALLANQPQTIEYGLVKADGQLRWVVDHAQPVWDEQQQRVVQIYGAVQDITERKQAEIRSAAFANLGHRLNATTNAKDAAKIIVDAADQLVGWDVCFIDRYSAESDQMLSTLLMMDTVDNQRVELLFPAAPFPPSPTERRTIERGGQLILLNDWETDHGDLIAIGAGDRQTISLLFVPIHNGAKIIGVLSIQSYLPQAYDRAALDTLQALADHCGGALERIAAEEQMQSSLHEKEVLLKEIYHRVKNNLQVVSSLLNLQSQRVADLTAVEVLRESQHRVRSMALIHERLYKSSDLARINFADYMRDLATFLFRSYNTDSATVQLQVIAEQDVQLNINTAIPCGLIVNELLSNALKHAFPDGRQGTVTMQLTRDTAGHISLSVADNGIGLPAEIDIDQTESLGLQLVKTLVQQIDGTLRLDRQSGTSFIITLPVVHEDPAD